MQYMGQAQAALHFNVSEGTIEKWAMDGKLTYREHGIIGSGTRKLIVDVDSLIGKPTTSTGDPELQKQIHAEYEAIAQPFRDGLVREDTFREQHAAIILKYKNKNS